MEEVAGNVKPLGRRDRKLSNVTPPSKGYFLHRYFRHTKVSPTPKYRGFENIGVVRFSLYESELLVLFLSDRN